jgi:hypothetical protein
MGWRFCCFGTRNSGSIIQNSNEEKIMFVLTLKDGELCIQDKGDLCLKIDCYIFRI